MQILSKTLDFPTLTKQGFITLCLNIRVPIQCLNRYSNNKEEKLMTETIFGENFEHTMNYEINKWLTKENNTPLIICIEEFRESGNKRYFENWIKVIKCFRSNKNVKFYTYEVTSKGA